MDGYREFVDAQRRLPPPDADMTELVRMATLAANGHNTQPWMFRLSTGRMTILPDFARRTAVVDPDDHHLFVSLGCAAENLAIAAAAQGRRAEIAFHGGPETRIDINLEAGPASRDAALQGNTSAAVDARELRRPAGVDRGSAPAARRGRGRGRRRGDIHRYP